MYATSMKVAANIQENKSIIFSRISLD